MAAKFTQGDSEQTTRSLVAKSPPKTARFRNTTNGMPGYINAHPSESMDHARGGKGVGPHREGEVGKRGSSGAKGMGKGAEGTTTKSYRASSTRSAGTLKDASSTGSHRVHTKERRVSMPGQKAPPTTSGNITGRRVGIDMAEHRAKNREAVVTGGNEGHPGRMERLSGSVRTRAEGRRKSSMY